MRITPACAGKTCLQSGGNRWGEDHPRLCGENRGESYEAFVEKGSPPPVRGKLDIIPLCRLRDRITPACAGKTFHCTAKNPRREDHPRLCGENFHLPEL